jgi:hypothetical protein
MMRFVCSDVFGDAKVLSILLVFNFFKYALLYSSFFLTVVVLISYGEISMMKELKDTTFTSTK